MDRELEQELLNCPIGELGSDEEQEEEVCRESQMMVPCYAPRLTMPLHDNYAERPGTIPPLDRLILSPSAPVSNTGSILNMASPPGTASFIEQVLRILDDAQLYNFEHIVSWQPDATSFKVHRILDFEIHILPQYLEQTKVRSFQRQLIKHGFERIQGGARRGAYCHPKFIRSDRKSCLSIEKVKRSRSFKGADPSEPPAVKLGEMSEHFRHAVQESKPCSLSPRGQKMTKNQIESTATTSPSFSNKGFIPNKTPAHTSLNPMSTRSIDCESKYLCMDHIPAAAPAGLDTPSVSTMNFWRAQPTRLADTSRPPSTKSPSPTASLERVSHKAILSKFLPTRLPGAETFTTDLNYRYAALLSEVPGPPTIDSPTNLEKYSLANLRPRIQRQSVDGPKLLEFPSGRGISRFNSASSQDVGSSIWDI